MPTLPDNNNIYLTNTEQNHFETYKSEILQSIPNGSFELTVTSKIIQQRFWLIFRFFLEIMRAFRL